MSEICYEPSQIFQPSGARAAPSRLGPPIRLLRSCPVFDALGAGREALRLGVGWLWCGGLHGSRCRRCRACCGFGPWQSGDAPVDYVDDSHVHVAAAGRVVDRDDAVQTIRERLPSFVVVRAAVRFFHYRSGLHEPFGAGVALLFGLFGPDHALVLPDEPFHRQVALPREFDARERFRALEDFISWNITANGYACTYAIHTDKDGRNPHAHILVANRRIDPKTGRWAAKSRSEFALDANGRRIPVIDPDTGRQKIGARNRKVWKRVNVSNNPLDSKEFLERLRREWADSCNALLPGYAVIDHRSFKARGIERIPTIHEGYASREMEKRGGRGDLCEENRRIQALNRLLDALRAMIGRLSDQAQGILTAVKRRQRPSGAPQAPSSPEPAERPQERPQARETPPQAPQEPPKPIRTKKALTDRFKTRLDERLAENERKQAEKQAEPDMEETWDLSDPADPLNIGMGWGTGGHGLGL